MLRFVSGLAVGALLAIGLPLLFLATGSVNVAATAAPGVFERTLAPWAVERALATHAPAAANPFGADRATLAAGLAAYREDCLVCHGAPGVPSGRAGKGLSPVPLPLDAPAVQRRRDGQLFWIVKHGIRLTGMPAFGPTREDDEIWRMVAFVRHLPELTQAERAELLVTGAGRP